MVGLRMLALSPTQDPAEAFAVALWLLTGLAVACTQDAGSEDRGLVLRAADELCKGWGLDS